MIPEISDRPWQRAMRHLSSLGFAAALIAALAWARTVLVPIALAIMITFILGPVVVLLRRRGFGNAAAVLTTVSVASITVIAMLAMVGWQFAELTSTLPDHSASIQKKLASARSALLGSGDGKFSRFIEEMQPFFTPPEDKSGFALPVVIQTSNSYSKYLNEVPGFLNPLTEILGQGAFAIVLSVFILFKKDDVRNRLIRLIGNSQLRTATKAIDDASHRISRYLFMQLIINSIFGVLISLTMFLLGIPYAILWGFFASMMRYIPYLGTWLGLIAPIIFTIAFVEAWWPLAVVIGVYATLELSCGNFFEPKLYGKSMGLSEVAQLVSAAFWAFVWGPVGLILSGPLTVCLLVLGKYVPQLQFLETILGDEQVLTADVRFYQRVAAGDHDGAAEIVRDASAKASTAEIYDTVIIPALGYAKQDIVRVDVTKPELARMLQITGEIVGELSEKESATNTDAAPAEKIRVLAVPAQDAIEALCLEMLRGSLDPKIWALEVANFEQLTSEVLQRTEDFKPSLVLIASMPPEGISHTRYLCKRLNRHMPDVQIIIGRWGKVEDTLAEQELLKEFASGAILKSFGETMLFLNAWRAALGEKQAASTKVNRNGAVGMVSANS